MVLLSAGACRWASDPGRTLPSGLRRLVDRAGALQAPPHSPILPEPLLSRGEREKDLPRCSCSARCGGSLSAGLQGTLTRQDLPALHRGLKPRLPWRGLTLTAGCPWVQGHFSAAGLEFAAELEVRGQVVRVCTPSLGEMPGLTLLEEGSANTGFLHLQERRVIRMCWPEACRCLQVG